jgi:hypothetical protein
MQDESTTLAFLRFIPKPIYEMAASAVVANSKVYAGGPAFRADTLHID